MMKLVGNSNGNSNSLTNTTSNVVGNNSNNSTSTATTTTTTTTSTNYSKTSYAPSYQNPPLAPRFLALSQQLQQQQQQGSNGFSNFGLQKSTQQQQQQQQQGASSYTSFQSTKSSTLSSTSTSSTTSTCTTRALTNSLGLSAAVASTVTNSATTALIANLANAATSQSFAPTIPQCTLNNTLFVGNLHASLQEIDLIQVFRPFGRIVECCKKWLHFGFVKFSTEEEACRAYVTLNGFRLKGRPMRLEFQNRTKKARIKAILAQAALQAATKASNENDDLFANHASSTSRLNMLLQQTNCQTSFKSQTTFNPNATQFMPKASVSVNAHKDSSDLTFFDTETLLKFATSPFEQQQQQQQTQVQQQHDHFNNDLPLSRCETPSTSITDHLEYTYSHSNTTTNENKIGSASTSSAGMSSNSDSAVSDDNDDINDCESCASDTSNDASIISDDFHNDDTTPTAAAPVDVTAQQQQQQEMLKPMEEFSSYSSMHSNHAATKYAQKLIKDVETFMSKSLDCGIYRSLNNTNSFFVEPEDILRPLEQDSYNEYQLFPMMEARFVESYPEFF